MGSAAGAQGPIEVASQNADIGRVASLKVDDAMLKDVLDPLDGVSAPSSVLAMSPHPVP